MKKTRMMIVLSCSICQANYDEYRKVPLTLQCGHCFCKECLARLFSSLSATSLSCPECRHVSAVGNSVSALPKNFSLLALLQSNSTSTPENDLSDSDDDVDRGDENAFGPLGGGHRIYVGRNRNLRLLQKISEGRRVGVEMWKGSLSGGSGDGGGHHQVAVKRVKIVNGMDVDRVLGEFEKLWQSSVWCRNVCRFHGAMVMDDHLCLVMDKCYGSVQLAMQRNEGRLTLEQILRFFFSYLLENL